MAPHLLVEGVDELLARGRARERGAVMERAAEAPEVEEPLIRAVEGHPHAVEEEDDAGPRLAHLQDRRLVGEEVAAVDRVVEVPPGRVALPFPVDRGVDAALRADRVRALHRDDREEIDGQPRLGDPDRRHEAGEATADDDRAGGRHPYTRNATRMANATTALYSGEITAALSSVTSPISTAPSIAP